MASIREVAKMAGVSTATVSNVLNGRSSQVGLETRDKVFAAVRHLKYRPTPLEHKQKAILNKNLGVIVPDLTEGPLSRHGYFRNVLDGVLEVAAMNGWSMTVFVQNMWDDAGHLVRRNYDGRCDGLVMIAPQPGNEIVQTLHDRGTPLILVGSTPWLDSISSVDIDNAAVGAAAARHLYELGHRQLAYLGNEWEQISSVERRIAFFREAKNLGLSEDQVTWIAVPRADSGQSEGEMAVSRVLEMKVRATGLFCWHDGLARPVVDALVANGFRIPEKFSVLSVDDAPEATLHEPQLTTFTNPLHDLGKRAAKMIIEGLTEGVDETERIRFAPELIMRQTTGVAPCE